jgi:hypothetical protein
MRRRGFDGWAVMLALLAAVLLGAGCSGDEQADRTPAADESLAALSSSPLRFALEAEPFKDKTGVISVEVPERWSDREEGEWKLDDGTVLGVRLVASTDIDKYFSSWDAPGVSVWASPLLGQKLAEKDSGVALADVYGALSPAKVLAKECSPQVQAYAIGAGKDDPFSQALGDTASAGIAQRYTACGGEATFSDMAVLTKDNVFFYAQLIAATAADQADWDQALDTLEVKGAQSTTPAPTPTPTAEEKKSIPPDASVDDLVKLFPEKVGSATISQEPRSLPDDATNLGAKAYVHAVYGYGDTEHVDNSIIAFDSIDHASEVLSALDSRASELGLKRVEEGTVAAGVQQVGLWKLYERSEAGKPTQALLLWTNGPYVMEVITARKPDDDPSAAAIAKDFYRSLPY